MTHIFIIYGIFFANKTVAIAKTATGVASAPVPSDTIINIATYNKY